MTVRILTGDCRTVLATLPAESVHCCVTSPPYWGLRDYGVGSQIGLEASVDAWVAELVGVFREVRRVLRDDGTLWLNLGDSYAGSWGAQSRGAVVQCVVDGVDLPEAAREVEHGPQARDAGSIPACSTISTAQVAAAPKRTHTGSIPDGAVYKPKDLIGQPWLVAFALRADGWYLRQEIIWHKPNPMPESITDRCTKAHEQIFLLSKSPRYYFDQDAIRTPLSAETKAQSFDTMDFKARDKYKMPDGWNTGPGAHGSFHPQGREKGRSKRDSFKREDSKRAEVMPGQSTGTHRPDRPESAYRLDSANRRTVWTVATEAFKEAHFATFPPALIEPCVLAGCPIGGTVLDPFGGAGTTGLVADRLQRDAVLIELNPAYAELARRRIHGDAPLFASVEAA